jgi:hypothetical protein
VAGCVVRDVNVLMYGEGPKNGVGTAGYACLSGPPTIVPQFRRPRRNSRQSKALHVVSNRQKYEGFIVYSSKVAIISQLKLIRFCIVAIATNLSYSIPFNVFADQ